MRRSLPLLRPSTVVAGLAFAALFLGLLDLDVGSVLAVFVVVAAAGVAEAAWDLWRGRASGRWPTVPGVVTASRLGPGKRPRPEIRYQYEVGAERYEGRRVRFAPLGSAGGLLGRFRPHPVLARYPVGTAVRVAYDPRAPRHAVLEPGAEIGGVAAAVAGLVGALLLARQFGAVLPFGLDLGAGRPRQVAQPPAVATAAARDPAVREALASCRPPSAAVARIRVGEGTPVGLGPLTCVVGYVSAARRDGVGQAVVYLDDLGADPGGGGIAVLILLEDPPSPGAVVRAWGALRPADEFPCTRAREPCLFVAPPQFAVIFDAGRQSEPEGWT